MPEPPPPPSAWDFGPALDELYRSDTSYASPPGAVRLDSNPQVLAYGLGDFSKLFETLQLPVNRGFSELSSSPPEVIDAYTSDEGAAETSHDSSDHVVVAEKDVVEELRRRVLARPKVKVETAQPQEVTIPKRAPDATMEVAARYPRTSSIKKMVVADPVGNRGILEDREFNILHHPHSDAQPTRESASTQQPALEGNSPTPVRLPRTPWNESLQLVPQQVATKSKKKKQRNDALHGHAKPVAIANPPPTLADPFLAFPQALTMPQNRQLAKRTVPTSVGLTVGHYSNGSTQDSDAHIPFQSASPPILQSPPAFAQKADPWASFREVLTVRPRDDREVILLNKLVQQFPEDRKWLISPRPQEFEPGRKDGIHVFIDASNIYIGFQQELKRLQGLHPKKYARAMGLSFDSLAWLLERKRPVAKRTVIGSLPANSGSPSRTPMAPKPIDKFFDDARVMGYVPKLLHRVVKEKQLTERQLFFQEHDSSGRPKRRKPAGGSGSDSETITRPTPAVHASVPTLLSELKEVEQGVDEMLHFEMSHSIVKCKNNPSTMILATGDAAPAEYSEGFLYWCEQALEWGWNIELYAWGGGLNKAYRDRDFLDRWSGQFRIYELDHYIEEMLDTE